MADTQKSVFDSVRPEIDFPRDEAKVLSFWKERDIFRKTLEATKNGSKGNFVFYEGPPTANGMPHNGHVLTRVIKDLFPRFKTMQGYHVPRKAGWDTHGLPVEVEVSKELRIPDKAGIEAYGIEPFTQKCIESVFRYTSQWERLTEKIGFWVDLDDAYVTFHKSYVESVWWALSRLFEKGLIYQGHKVVWWWAQGGTALSSHEVAQGWKLVDDPSVFVRLPLRDDPSTSLVVWTTTPWTLPSNMYAAVSPKYDYVVVKDGDKRLIVAEALRETIEKKIGRPLEVERRMKGAELVGKAYVPPFDVFYKDYGGLEAVTESGKVPAFWRVVAADFVTLDSGSGIVHVAPAFGEDDHKLHQALLRTYRNAEEIPLLSAVKEDGKFKDLMGEQFAGRWVKSCDSDLSKILEDKGLLVHSEAYRHDYPFCWRSEDDPLIQLARPAWYVRTTARVKDAIENNQHIQWIPEHIKDGRFGDFLENNVDWALSRERYWGTPLNVWVCTKNPEHMHAPDSVAAIEKLNPHAFDKFYEAKKKDPSLSEHLMVHKPWVDHVTFPCPVCGAEMRRVPEVIDCWFDSGCMPFAQWGYPHVEGSKEKFDQSFPADFISEAIDQTRGWFYSLLMVSSLVFDEETQKKMGLSYVRPYPHPYKTCIVLGHTCDKDGKKESKSKGNYTPPEIILDEVRMDFAVLSKEQAGKKVPEPKDGEVWIAQADLEGLDLDDGAEVQLFRPDRDEKIETVKVRGTRKLPRRLVVMPEQLMQRLDVSVSPAGADVMVAEVPRLEPSFRVSIRDPKTPAPGADAFRWFFYAASPPWTNTRHSLTNVRLAQKDFQIKLRNVYSFFTIYANIDGFNPAEGIEKATGISSRDLAEGKGYRPVKERSLLDRWILSELALTVRDVTKRLEAYRVYEAAQRLIDMADALSNWYVRRSRQRFWAPGFEQDKRDAYWTLYEVLVTLSRLLAPFVPFFAEEMYQNLVRRPWPDSQPESVHMTSWPEVEQEVIDEDLSVEMRTVRDLVSLGLQVRTNHQLKVRQPLRRMDVVLADQSLAERLRPYESLLASEVNVHEVRWLEHGQEGGEVSYSLKPNFRALGPRLGKRVQLARKALAKADAGELRRVLVETGQVELELEDGTSVTLTAEDVQVGVDAAEGFAAAGDKVGVVVLNTSLDDELIDEGLERECISRIQAVRKQLDLDYTARIRLAVEASERVERVLRDAAERVAKEVLATSVDIGKPDFEPLTVKEVKLDGAPMRIAVALASE